MNWSGLRRVIGRRREKLLRTKLLGIATIKCYCKIAIVVDSSFGAMSETRQGSSFLMFAPIAFPFEFPLKLGTKGLGIPFMQDIGSQSKYLPCGMASAQELLKPPSSQYLTSST